jgi:hypothetical protein
MIGRCKFLKKKLHLSPIHTPKNIKDDFEVLPRKKTLSGTKGK